MIFTITGSSGLIGRRLKQRLIQRGHSVKILSFKGSNNPNAEKDFKWEPENGKIDAQALEGADSVIHLAGETIAQRWTPAAKSRILRSRSLSSQLLVDELKKVNPTARMVSASGIGFYPDPSLETLNEQHPAGSGFLAQVCRQWEAPLQSLMQDSKAHIFRTGLVLSNQGGVLPLVQRTAAMGIVPMTGSGQNIWSWIHIEDLVSAYIAAAENSIPAGIYNAVSPNPCTQKDLAMALLRIKGKTPWKWAPCIPDWALKVLLGEQSQLALTNQPAMANKLIETGFVFAHEHIEPALEHLNNHHEL